MAGTTVITPPLRIGTNAARPSASSVPESFYYAPDTRELSVSDGAAWTVVNGSSAHPPQSASGTLTVLAGQSSQVAGHGLSGVPLAAVEPIDDTLGARYRFAVGGTNISVTLDHAQAADIRFYWMAVVF